MSGAVILILFSVLCFKEMSAREAAKGRNGESVEVIHSLSY